MAKAPTFDNPAENMPDKVYPYGNPTPYLQGVAEFIPYTGDVSDIYALFAGKTLYTGETVETSDKFIIMMGAVLPVVNSKEIKAVVKWVAPWSKGPKGTPLANLIGHYNKHKEEFGKIGKNFTNQIQYAEGATDFIKKEGSFEYYLDKDTKNYIKYDRITQEFSAFNDKEINSYFIRGRKNVDKQIKKGRFQKLDKNPSQF